MKKRFRSIISLLLIIVIISSIVTVVPISVEATSSVIENALQWAINIANDDSHLYVYGGSHGSEGLHYDCSSFVSWALVHAGLDVPISTTQYMRGNFEPYGFDWIPWSDIGGTANLKRGDILLNEQYHVEFYLGNNQNVGAHSSKRPAADQINIDGYYYYPWDGVLRYKDEPINPPTNVWLGKNQVWYDIQDTIYLAPHADGADYYWFSVYKDDQQIVSQAIYGEYSFAANQWGYGNYSAYITAANSAGGTNSEWIDFSVVGNPSYNRVYKSSIWYDLSDTVDISVEPVCAKGQVIGIDKEGVGRVVTENCDTTFSIAASQLGIGNYSAYFSVYNGSGSIDTEWITFSIVGDATYSDVYCNKSVYRTDENVSITVDTVCAKGQVIGIDKEGVGRVITESCDNTFTISANQLGVGKYSAYFSVYNGSGGIDTKRVSFEIVGEYNSCELGNKFFAVIKNKESGNIADNINGNVVLNSEAKTSSQVWKFIRNEDNTYIIVSVKDNTAIDVNNGDNQNGTNIQTYQSNGTDAQRWYIVNNRDGYLLIPKCAITKAMDLCGAKTIEGTNFQIWENYGNSTQTFILERIDDLRDYLWLYEIADTNLDGNIDIRDVTAIQRHICELELFTDEQFALADTNGDGNIDISDATHLQKYLAEFNVALGKQS